jgi:hypothetical protein
LSDPRVLLVIEADLFTLMIEEPLLAGFADELLKSISCRVFERRPIKVGSYASSLGEAGDGRGNAVCRRDSAGAKGRTGE